MTAAPSYPRVARFRTAAELRSHLEALAAPIPLDDEPLSAAAGSPLAAPLALGDRTVGNRWCIHPMEGWDAASDGRPSELVLRRWRRFGTSGAKLIWGGEAVAVVPEGRANPNQLCAPACGRAGYAALLEAVRGAHLEAHGRDDDLVVALQLTHSGRFSKPSAAGRAPRILRDLGVVAVNLTAGSPYTVPHISRPAAFPPSDGYPPPEDPLVGCWRQIDAARQAKAAVPDLVMLGTAYTYLQDYVVHAAQATVRQGWIDGVGLGRMVLSYPELPADSLAGRPLARTAVCRTFSDCTTAPRHGLRSGCYPLDAYYKALPEAAEIKAIKARLSADS